MTWQITARDAGGWTGRGGHLSRVAMWCAVARRGAEKVVAYGRDEEAARSALAARLKSL